MSLQFLFTDNPGAKRALQMFMERVRVNAHRAIAAGGESQAVAIFSPARQQGLAGGGNARREPVVGGMGLALRYSR